jgi:hypothetical protein
MRAAYVLIEGQYYSPGHEKAKAYSQSVAGLAPAKPQQNSIRALECKPSARKSRKRSVVIVIAIQPYVSRSVDDDNFGSGAYKSLRDQIAHDIGVDDGDPRIRWEYHPPIITTGATGTNVTVSRK